MHHREYDLRGASVMLLPRNLPRRWLWSRKYPICLKLRANDGKMTSQVSSPVAESPVPFEDPDASLAEMEETALPAAQSNDWGCVT